MRHARLDVASLAVERVPVALQAAYLLVVEQEGFAHLQWECLAYALDPLPIARGRYRVDITTLDGRVLWGPAVLVRSHEGAHVLRGDGHLEGFDRGDLPGGSSAAPEGP